jgi:hypothetical protein
MRGLLPHTIFAGILIVSVAMAGRATDVLNENNDIEPAVIRVARSHGLTLRKEETTTKEAVRTLVFEPSGCGSPLSVTLLSVTFEEEPLVQMVRGESDVVRYIYLNHVWTAPDRLASFFEWKLHKALRLFGLTQYVPSRYMLRVASPPGCRLVDAIDWRIVWKRELAESRDADVTTN